MRVHGVAMPTMEGIANVLNHIGAKKKGKQTRILWHSLREEPVRVLMYTLEVHHISSEHIPFLLIEQFCISLEQAIYFI